MTGNPKDNTQTPSTIATRTANWLSWILVPLLMPTIGMVLILTLSMYRLYLPISKGVSVTCIVFAITALLPMVAFWLLKQFGFIDDVALNGRKERLLPYIITTLSYLLAAFYIFKIGAPSWMVMFFAGGAVASVVNMIVNLWWKISAHAAGVAGVAAMLAIMTSQPESSPATFGIFLGWLVLCGLLGTARVWLRRHTPLQVAAGYLVGYLSVALMSLITF